LNYPKALPFYPAYDYLGHRPGDFPNTFRDQNEILSIPIYPEMTKAQVGYVARALADF
jgi:dTDP-4-amino-4,6-dideoxygalactose transaminase